VFAASLSTGSLRSAKKIAVASTATPRPASEAINGRRDRSATSS